MKNSEMSRAGELPLVSIVIPVYNGANYMKEAIDSALAQDYPNIEVIVVNDGSRDEGETDRIAKEYGDRIRYIAKENGGVSTALNAGIKAMKGEYFSWLSHDDLYKPGKVSRQVSLAMKQEDPHTVVIGGYELFDGETGAFLGERLPTDLYTPEQLSKPLFGVFHGLINGCSMLIHRSHFERIGLFDETLKTTQDYDMWFRLLRGQRACYHDDAHVRSRCHPQQESRAAYHGQDCFDLWKRLMDSTDAEERTAMSGGEALFFRDVYRFLSEHTPYEAAAAYAREQLFVSLAAEGYTESETEKKIEQMMAQHGEGGVPYRLIRFARKAKNSLRRRLGTVCAGKNG